MTVEELIKKLQACDRNQTVLLSSDEEMNTLYKSIAVGQIEDLQGEPIVLYGLSGSEIYDD